MQYTNIYVLSNYRISSAKNVLIDIIQIQENNILTSLTQKTQSDGNLAPIEFLPLRSRQTQSNGEPSLCWILFSIYLKIKKTSAETNRVDWNRYYTGVCLSNLLFHNNNTYMLLDVISEERRKWCDETQILLIRGKMHEK